MVQVYNRTSCVSVKIYRITVDGARTSKNDEIAFNLKTRIEAIKKKINCR